MWKNEKKMSQVFLGRDDNSRLLLRKNDAVKIGTSKEQWLNMHNLYIR